MQAQAGGALLLLIASIVAVATQTQQYSAGTLVVSNPWCRPTFEGMPTGVAYLSITNRGRKQHGARRAGQVTSHAVRAP